MDKDKEQIPTNDATLESNKSSSVSSGDNAIGGQTKMVETYAEDMAQVIGDNGGELVKKIIEGEARKEEEKLRKSPEARKNKIYLILSFILLFFALVTFIYLLSREDGGVVNVEQQFTPIIFNDKSFFIEVQDLSRDEIITSILTEVRESKLKDGGLEGIYLTRDKQLVGLRDFLITLKSSLILPEEILVSDNFLFGFVKNTEKNPFILIKMRSFADVFENMKGWEKKTFYDLRSLFNVPINSDTAYLLTKDFEDGIVVNKNARILYDKDGQIVLMYVYADDTSIIISDDINTTKEIIFRLSSGKIKK